MKIRGSLVLPAMKTRVWLVISALLLASNAQAARAQAPEPKRDEAEDARAELERKALGLLGEALAEAQGLRLPENRLRAQITAARLLWPRDAKAGRAAFKSAADALAEMSASLDPEDVQFYAAAQTVAQLRAELVQVAGQFDTKLALDFLRATRPAYGEGFDARGRSSQEQTLELGLAGQIAAQEPQRAFELAEESLGRGGVSTGLLSIIHQLRTKDPALAAKLAAAVARRLRAEDLRQHFEAGAVAQQLLLMSRPAESLPPNTTAQLPYNGPVPFTVGTPGGAPLLDEQTRRELFEKVLSAVASSQPGEGGAYNLTQVFQALLPEVERLPPARAAALRRRAEELERSVNPQLAQARAYQKVLQSGTLEELLDAAQKAPAEVRDQLYVQAAWRAFGDGDAERARQIVENVSNPQQRGQVRRGMEQQTQWRALKQDGFAEARAAALRMKMVEDSVPALLQLAQQMTAAGDKQNARQALEDARGLIDAQTRGQQQFRYRLQVANAYAQFDTAAAFDAVESAVVRLDELLEAAAVVDGFFMEAFKDGELKPQGYMWAEMVSQCAQTLSLLARADFERASSAGKKFRRPEARTLAQLVIAQSLLATLPLPQQGGVYANRPAVISRPE